MADQKHGTKVLIPASEAESIKQNLARVQDELVRVRDKAREEADALDRIRGMIDLKYLNELLGAVESLEERVNTMEGSGAPDVKAADSATKAELKKEQQRLAKLWDAFKAQEDELREAEKERDDILKKLQSLDATLAEIGSPADVNKQITRLERENARMAAELDRVGADAQVFQAEFGKEQQRLAKLFKVYEDLSAQVHQYQQVEKKWADWRKVHWPSLPAEARRAGDKIA